MCMASKGTGACAWAQTSCIWGRLALGSYQGTHCMHARKHSTGLAWCMPLGVHRYFLPARTSSFRTGACTQRPSGRGMHGPARRIAACFARMWCVGGMFSYSCFCMIPRDHANMAPLQHVCAHIFPLQVHIASCPARFWVFFCGSPAGGGVSGTSPRGGPSWSTSGRSPLSQRGAPAEDTEGREVEACALALEGCAFRSRLRHVYSSTVRELWSCTHVSPRTCCCSCMRVHICFPQAALSGLLVFFAGTLRAVWWVGLPRETCHLGRSPAEVRACPAQGACGERQGAWQCGAARAVRIAACEWPRGFYRAHVEAYGGVGSLPQAARKPRVLHAPHLDMRPDVPLGVGYPGGCALGSSRCTRTGQSELEPARALLCGSCGFPQGRALCVARL